MKSKCKRWTKANERRLRKLGVSAKMIRYLKANALACRKYEKAARAMGMPFEPYG